MSSEYARQDYYVTQMLDKMDFVLLPVMNVDGYVYSWANSVCRKLQKTSYILGQKNLGKPRFSLCIEGKGEGNTPSCELCMDVPP